jgi:hypothetical protein
VAESLGYVADLTLQLWSSSHQLEPEATGRAPPEGSSEEEFQVFPLGCVDVAPLLLEVDANLLDDERSTLDRGLAVPGHAGRAFGDDVTLVGLPELKVGVIVEITTDPGAVEPAGRPQVELDPPVPVSFPKVERVAFDGTSPLLRGHPTVARDHDVRVDHEPGDQLVLFSVAGRRFGPALRRFPVRIRARLPIGEPRLALLGREAAPAAEAVVVEVAVREAGVARADAGDFKPVQRVLNDTSVEDAALTQ